MYYFSTDNDEARVNWLLASPHSIDSRAISTDHLVDRGALHLSVFCGEAVNRLPTFGAHVSERRNPTQIDWSWIDYRGASGRPEVWEFISSIFGINHGLTLRSQISPDWCGLHATWCVDRATDSFCR